VSAALASLKNQYISMPDDAECDRMKQKFYAEFPGVIGCIECTHIKVACPRNVNNAAVYMNRKGYYSLNVQMVTDVDLKVQNVVT